MSKEARAKQYATVNGTQPFNREEYEIYLDAANEQEKIDKERAWWLWRKAKNKPDEDGMREEFEKRWLASSAAYEIIKVAEEIKSITSPK